jgi:hypothetical protein
MYHFSLLRTTVDVCAMFTSDMILSSLVNMGELKASRTYICCGMNFCVR